MTSQLAGSPRIVWSALGNVISDADASNLSCTLDAMRCTMTTSCDTAAPASVGTGAGAVHASACPPPDAVSAHAAYNSAQPPAPPELPKVAASSHAALPSTHLNPAPANGGCVFRWTTVPTEAGDKLLVSGPTFEYKDIFKKMGGFFRKPLGWLLPLNAVSALLTFTSVPPPPAPVSLFGAASGGVLARVPALLGTASSVAGASSSVLPSCQQFSYR